MEPRPAPQTGLVSRPRHERGIVALNFRVPFEVRQRIKLAATTRGVTMTELVMAAVESYLLPR